jgi:alginate O-acetyltransferase complex protein AlgI
VLFNSFQFIFGFLPVTFIVFFLLNYFGKNTASRIWLVIASLFFYSWWNIIYLPLIISSMLVNFYVGFILQKVVFQNINKRKWVLILGVAFNILLLGYFKYFDFFISNVNFLLSSHLKLLHTILPLGISFFTFTQIAYLADAYKNETREYNFISYALFVTYFPHLLAGPILHHSEMMPQFESSENKTLNYKNISIGLFVFFIGLCKKIIIADTFAIWANSGFDSATSLTLLEAWIVSLSYTLQLYFDFSGYTDMAIGVSLLFNIKLPKNFNSPYKSLNIQDFWRRWHMTLGRFLTQYVYIPLGGNRKGEVRTYINVLVVFLISGLWHGAGWTFIFWGFLHGIASVINRAWSKFNIKMPKIIAWFITINFVNLSWIFFRAKNWDEAWGVLRGMFGFNGLILPNFSVPEFWNMYHIPSIMQSIIMVIMFIFVVVKFKNSIELEQNFKPNMKTAFLFSTAILIGLLTLLANINKVSEFLYFNF